MVQRSKSSLRRDRRKYRAQSQIINFKEKLELSEDGAINITRGHKKISEFEVQAELFSKLKNEGIKVRGEYSQLAGARVMVRFDLIVFPQGRRPIIIEVKSGKSNTIISKAQISKYSKFNADLLYCIGIEQVDETFNEVVKIIG